MSSLQDLENGMIAPVAEATGYTIQPLSGFLTPSTRARLSRWKGRHSPLMVGNAADARNSFAAAYNRLRGT